MYFYVLVIHALFVEQNQCAQRDVGYQVHPALPRNGPVRARGAAVQAERGVALPAQREEDQDQVGSRHSRAELPQGHPPPELHLRACGTGTSYAACTSGAEADLVLALACATLSASRRPLRSREPSRSRCRRSI